MGLERDGVVVYMRLSPIGSYDHILGTRLEIFGEN